MGLKTPMTWLTAYADLDGNNLSPIPAWKQALINMAKRFFPNDYDDSKADHWVGLRPVSPDDLPIIGKSTKFDNLYYNVGQGSWGIGTSIGSGKLLANLINN